jgi:tetrapyrrole methylase family protein/MazG family protein
VVVGLGPGDPRLVSTAAMQTLDGPRRLFLRTARHPSASLAEGAESFDDLYERASEIDSVYDGIVERLVEEAGKDGEVVYAVPGSPLVAERTVVLLREDPRVETVVVPSLSFIDLVWDRLGIDPFAASAALIDGHRFAEEAAGRTGPFLVGQCDSRLVLSEIKLAVDNGPEVVALQRLGLPDEKLTRSGWADLDRSFEPDHLSCLWIPALENPVAAEMTRFAELVRTLRERCPWDAAQTHHSLARHLIEETYETIEAIDGLAGEDGYRHLEEELGDLLFQVGFHANLAAEAGQFDLVDVARGIREKLVARHPHVFGPPGHPAPDWEAQKRQEKRRASAMDGVPRHLPALLYATKVQSRAASVGFDWKETAGVWDKIREELDELTAALEEHPDAGPAVDDELGDVLFSVVNLARHLGVDAESALRIGANKFRDRFQEMERLARQRNRGIGEDLWEEVKAGRPVPHGGGDAG